MNTNKPVIPWVISVGVVGITLGAFLSVVVDEITPEATETTSEATETTSEATESPERAQIPDDTPQAGEVPADAPPDYVEDMTILDLAWFEMSPSSQEDICWGYENMGQDWVISEFEANMGSDSPSRYALVAFFDREC